VPTAWYFAPYKRRAGALYPTRYCSIDDYTTLVSADGGAWSEAECLGNSAVVKVRASQATLDTIAADPNILRVPLALLDSTLERLNPFVPQSKGSFSRDRQPVTVPVKVETISTRPAFKRAKPFAFKEP
jgi:hypothetical protein